jgi:hypothetical protein
MRSVSCLECPESEGSELGFAIDLLALTPGRGSFWYGRRAAMSAESSQSDAPAGASLPFCPIYIYATKNLTPFVISLRNYPFGIVDGFALESFRFVSKLKCLAPEQ